MKPTKQNAPLAGKGAMIKQKIVFALYQYTPIAATLIGLVIIATVVVMEVLK